MYTSLMRQQSRVPLYSSQGHAQSYLSFYSGIYGDARSAGFSTTSLHLRYQLLGHLSSSPLVFIAYEQHTEFDLVSFRQLLRPSRMGCTCLCYRGAASATLRS